MGRPENVCRNLTCGDSGRGGTAALSPVRGEQPHVLGDRPRRVASATWRRAAASPAPRTEEWSRCRWGRFAREAGRRWHGARPLRQIPPFIDEYQPNPAFAPETRPARRSMFNLMKMCLMCDLTVSGAIARPLAISLSERPSAINLSMSPSRGLNAPAVDELVGGCCRGSDP